MDVVRSLTINENDIDFLSGRITSMCSIDEYDYVDLEYLSIKGMKERVTIATENNSFTVPLNYDGDFDVSRLSKPIRWRNESRRFRIRVNDALDTNSDDIVINLRFIKRSSLVTYFAIPIATVALYGIASLFR